jgi:hypothetical protein
MQVIQVNSKYYHNILDNFLSSDKRVFLDRKIVADKYFLAFNNGDIIGGFAVSYSGLCNGLFALKSGYNLNKVRLHYAIKYNNSGYLTLNCIGNDLMELYSKNGFFIHKKIKWNYKLAPNNWNYSKYGTPFIYTMIKFL